MSRSVAEIIGWQRIDAVQTGSDLFGNPIVHDGCCTCRWRDPDGETWDESCEPPDVTVDDLIAWLHSQTIALSIQTWLGREEVAVSLHAVTEYPIFRALTVLAALEAAVRAVDEATP